MKLFCIALFSMAAEIGAVGDGNTVTFTLAKPGGEPFTLSVKPREPDLKDVNAVDELHVPGALYRKHPAAYYWYEYLSDSRVLYIQYNTCQNDPKQSMTDFARGLFASADARPVDRAIVDLRFNGGGDSRVINPLKSGLRSRHYPVFVLIGDGSFSSAQDNAIEMRRELNATLVGEPTGEKLNSYGEVRQLKLPNSGLRIRYSTEFFRMQKHGDADALYPDVAAPRTLSDFLAGRDPALDAALRSQPRCAK
jgi:C-terminal processing protease CtpA/Prc